MPRVSTPVFVINTLLCAVLLWVVTAWGAFRGLYEVLPTGYTYSSMLMSFQRYAFWGVGIPFLLVHVPVLLGLWTALPVRLVRFLPWLCLPTVIATVGIQGIVNGSLEASSRDGFLASTLTASLVTAFVSGALLARRMPLPQLRTRSIIFATAVSLCILGVLYYLKARPPYYTGQKQRNCFCHQGREIQIPD